MTTSQMLTDPVEPWRHGLRRGGPRSRQAQSQTWKSKNPAGQTWHLPGNTQAGRRETPPDVISISHDFPHFDHFYPVVPMISHLFPHFPIVSQFFPLLPVTEEIRFSSPLTHEPMAVHRRVPGAETEH